MTEKELYDLASKWVCPNSGVATTQYEIHAVRNLVMFGTAVLAAAQQSVQRTGKWDCSCGEADHINPEFTACPVCGLPRR